jgi:hypothetical protein
VASPAIDDEDGEGDVEARQRVAGAVERSRNAERGGARRPPAQDFG